MRNRRPSEPQGKDASDGAAAPPQPQPPIAQGDLAAHIPIIRNYLRKIIRDDELEDGVQTVLARALENLVRYRGESSPRVWLLGIARNVGYEIARGRQRRPVLAKDSDESGGPDLAAHDVNAVTQEEMLGNKEHQALTLTALDGLSLDEKLALLVTYVDNLPGPEAADILGVSFAAFRQRLARARQSLARELQRVMAAGVPGSAEVLAQWQTLLNPQPRPSSGRPKERALTNPAASLEGGEATDAARSPTPPAADD